MISLPNEVSNFLFENQKTIKDMMSNGHQDSNFGKVFFDHFFKLVNEHFKTTARVLIKKHLQCFGPKLCGPNIMVNLAISPSNSLMNQFKYQVELEVTPEGISTT